MLVEFNSKLIPVSTSVMMILYSLMTPFCSLAGGGFQDKKTDLDVEATPVWFCGGLVGTVEKITPKWYHYIKLW